MTTIPLKPQLILAYREVFGTNPPDRLDLIRHICRNNLIAEFAGLNYRLKPKVSKFHDKSLKHQNWELKYFCGGVPELLQKYARAVVAHTKSNEDYPLIFTRQMCLYALEEITQSDIPVIENFDMRKPEIWDSLMQYILAVNSQITIYGERNPQEQVNFETLNSKSIPLNELSVDTDPLYIPYRGLNLLEYLLTVGDMKHHVCNYFKTTYSVPYDNFIYESLGMYYANNQENAAFNFVYTPREDSHGIFQALCQKYPSIEVQKLLSVRKYPFYFVDGKRYFLMDNTLLMEKCYGQFINDFWFDYLKPLKKEDQSPLFDYKYYRSIIGYFFESYTRSIIDYTFDNSNNYIIKVFDQLKINVGKNEVEIADIYIRKDRKAIVGQVKATGIYDNEKYSGSLNGLYRNNRNEFFKSFGIDQLIASIKMLKGEIKQVDPECPAYNELDIFPVIIVNEKALQTPFMGSVFQDRFVELIKQTGISLDNIRPLTLIHISDLENIQDHFHERPDEIWSLLEDHSKYYEFMPPFAYSILMKEIRPNYRRTRDMFESLIKKYSVN